MPRGSSDYAENIYNQNIYGCKKIFHTTIAENIKNFSTEPKNFISNIAYKIEFINKKKYKFSIKKNKKKITTNISYSKYWNIKDHKNNELKKFNDKNFLGFYTNGSKDFELKYNNTNEKLFILLKFIFGFLTVTYFFFCFIF